MLCQNCQRADATTHLKRITNGEYTEIHLCAECAAALGVTDVFPGFGSAFGDLLGAAFSTTDMKRVGNRVLRCETCGFTFDGLLRPPHHTPADTPFIASMLRRYSEFTGRKGECLSMGGGTYVHDIPGGVAFGAGMPGFESNLHGANERMNIADMLTAIKIFAAVIYDLCA